MDSTNAEWWTEQRDWLRAQAEKHTDAEVLEELRLATAVCDQEIARLS